MIYTVTLNPSLDYIAKTDNINIGKTNRTSDEYIVPGGKGLNVSILLSRLGVDTTALGFSAGFTGAELERLLKETGIKTDFSEAQGTTRINVKISHSEITEFNGSGVSLGKSDIENIKSKIAELKNGDWLVLSGSIPKGADAEIYKELASAAPEGVRVVVDAVGEPLRLALETKPFLIKPNRDELEDFFSVSIKTEADVILFGKKLQALGARNVLISLGEKGAVLLSEDFGIHSQLPPKGETKNTVAAGDSMIAGFIKRYEETKNFEDSLKFSVAAGSATAYSDWIAQRELIEELYNSVC